MNRIVITSALVLLFLIHLICYARQNRRRKARLDEIAMAPLPQLPLSFQWNWWGIVLFMVISAIPVVLFWLIGVVVGAKASMEFLCLLAFIAPAYYVYGYLRFSLKGPAFVLDADGISFAGNYLLWRDVSEIDYVLSGKTPNIRFRNTGSKVKGFSILDQLYGKTSVSARFISDPDSLVGWSRRLKEKSRGACQGD